MVQVVTPSPTPSADGYQQTLVTAMRHTSSPWPASSMSKSPHEQWQVDTPPPEEGILYSQNLSYPSDTYHQVVSRPRHPSTYLPSGPFNQHSQASSWSNFQTMGSSSRGSPYPEDKASSEHGDEGERVPAPRTKTAKKATTRSKSKNTKDLKFPDLKVSLSVWGANNNVQPVDIAGYATRPSDERRDERAKDGYVKRNLNPFFLYKKAYSRVGKAWLAIHHPYITTQPPLVKLVSESWRKESAEVETYYKKFSKEEKEGLKKAFPDYKYKPGTKKALGKNEQVEERCVNDSGPPTTLKRDRSGHFVDQTQQVPYGGYGCRPAAFNESAVPPPYEHFYYTGAMPVAHGAGPMITDQATTFLQPNHVGWVHSMNERPGQAASPAPSQISYQTADHMPIDPSLVDPLSDCGHSREKSEEPGFVAPSQLTYSRVASAEPMIRSQSDLSNPADWMSNPAMSRCASEEPWQEMPDAFLTSLPSNDLPDPTSAEHYWHLETMEKNNHLQGFAWDTKDWEHDFTDELALI